MGHGRRALGPAAALLLLSACAAVRTERAADPLLRAVADLGARSDADRARAAGDLERAGEEAVPALLGALDRGSELERYGAVRVLGRIGAPAAAAAPRLVAMLRDEELSIPLALAEALAGIGAPALPALRELAADADDTNRYWAIHAVGAMRPLPPDGLAVLVDALNDPEDAVQGQAAIGLVRAGAIAVPSLLRLLLGEDLDRAFGSAELLEKIGTPEARAALAADRSAPGEGDEEEESGQVDERAP